MPFKHPNATNSALLSGLLFLITLSGLQIWSAKLASTPQLTIVGGFISSLLFFFGLIFVGNFQNETKWIEVIFVLLVAEIAAATVHRVCVTTCFLFSLLLLAYLQKVARSLHERK